MTHYAGVTDEGELIKIIQPFAFPLQVTCGTTCLSQAAVRFKHSPYMTNKEVLQSGEIRFSNGCELPDVLNSHGLKMTFRTHRAYRAKSYNPDMPPIDMDARGTLDWRPYFELIEGNNDLLTDKKTLYLLGSQGRITLGKVFGILSREHGVITGTGAWSHLAGFFQPFWNGQATFEFYSHEKSGVQRCFPNKNPSALHQNQRRKCLSA